MNAYRRLVSAAALSLIILLESGCGEKSVIGGNQPPAVPSHPVPSDGALSIGVNTHLSWECSDPDGNNLTYNLYFGNSIDPPLISSGLEEADFDPGRLEYGMTYYWRVVASDGRFQTEGPLWTFTARTQPEIQLRGSLELFDWLGNLWISGDYVYYCRYGTLQIIDVTDPSAPFVANTMVEEGDAGFDEVFVRNDIMYVAAYHDGIRVYDVANVYAPVLLGESHWDNLWNAVTIYVVGDYAYIGDFYGASVHAIDISDPGNPVRLSYTELLIQAGSAKQIFVYDNYAYVQMDDTMPPTISHFAIVNETDIENPEVVSVLDPATRGVGLYCYRDHLFIPSGNLHIFDISDPANAFQAAEYETGRSAVDIFIQGDLACLALADSGVMILDVSDPVSPELIAEADMPDIIVRVVAEDNYVYLVSYRVPKLYIVELVG